MISQKSDKCFHLNHKSRFGNLNWSAKKLSCLETIVRRGRLISNMADKNPDKSYGWTSAQNFNDYMEGVIGTDLFSINACL